MHIASYAMQYIYSSSCIYILVMYNGTDLMQCCTHEWHALESNPLSTKLSSIHHWVRVDALVKYVRKKHSQQELTEYLISNS